MLEIEIVEVSVTQVGFALLLKPPGNSRVVPIFIGPLETYSISTALENETLERPLTHDLMKSAFVAMGCNVEKIIVDDFKEGTFYAKMHIQFNQASESSTSLGIDCRPSDAIAMAIRFKAPIYMSEEVYDKTAIDVEHLKEKIYEENFQEGLKPDVSSQSPDINLQEIHSEFIQGILREFHSPPPSSDKDEGAKLKQTPTGGSKSKERKKDKNFQSKMDVLSRMLQNEIGKENYEEAAKIRDELAELTHTHAKDLLKKSANSKNQAKGSAKNTQKSGSPPSKNSKGKKGKNKEQRDNKG